MVVVRVVLVVLMDEVDNSPPLTRLLLLVAPQVEADESRLLTPDLRNVLSREQPEETIPSVLTVARESELPFEG